MKLNKLSRVAQFKQADTVIQSRQYTPDERSRGMSILMQAQDHYMAMEQFRRDRERNKRYNYGDQWGDVICFEGKRMTEEEYILKQGSIPLKNNMIRRLTRNVVGVFRNQNIEPTCFARDRNEQMQAEIMSTMLQYNMQLNKMNEVYARSMEEFLISGFVVHRKWHGLRNGKQDCWTDVVQPNNFFIDSNMRDFRGWDCSCLGEIHDIDFKELCGQFARSPEDYKRLGDIYSYAKNNYALTHIWEQFGHAKIPNTSFLLTDNDGRCRVIEVWRKESKPRYWCHDFNTGEVYKIDEEDYKMLVHDENDKRIEIGIRNGMSREDIPLIEARWFVDNYWYYYFLSPLGDILQEGETPYAHGGHPYVFKAYPFIDGEIHSFVADVIDQQRYTNRLITLYDFIMRASAKGLLLVPEDSIPKGMSPEDFSDTWARFNGVLVYKPSKSGAVPHQVANNSTNIGINELLQLQLKLFEEISGVNGALQGKPGYSGMSAALYSQQTQNATTSLLDLLEAFNSFMTDAAYKDVKNIQQFYDDERTVEISGSRSRVQYTPSKIRNIEFDLSIVPSTSTPAYRAMANDMLMQIWQTGQITLEQMLKTGQFPFGDQLLQTLESQKEQMRNGEAPKELPESLRQAVENGANMQAVEQAQQMLRPQ